MVPPFDYLDSMMWSLAAIGVVVGVMAIKLPFKASTGTVEGASSTPRGYAVALAMLGSYLFITGLSISFIWPFGFAGGVYNVLFGGSAALGGLVVLAAAIALFLNVDLKPVTYLAAVVGLYLLVAANGILTYGLTREPTLSALWYVLSAIPSLLSVPAFHTDNRKLRVLFAIFAFLFALAWLFEGVTATTGHLAPPPPE